MSIKRMITKLALAFAAKKGVEAFRSIGGLSGLKNMLQGTPGTGEARGGMQGRIGGASDAQTGGLGNILGSLGAASASGPREAGVTGQISPLNQSLGAVFGNLASALGQRSEPESAVQDFEDQLETDDIENDDAGEYVIRAMVQMARADGAIDDSEQEILFEILNDVSASEKAILTDALREPVDPHALASATPAHARKEVYAAALLVGQPGNDKERDYLKSFGFGLGLSAAEISNLHRAMGKSEFSS